MARTLNDYIAKIRPLIRTTVSGAVEDDDIEAALNRGIDHLKQECGIFVTKNRATLDVFPTVYEYPLPSDFHDLINIQTPGRPRNFRNVSPDEFWRRLDSLDNIIAVDAIEGTRFLLLKASASGDSTQLHNCDDHDANGTWTADTSGSDATNVTTDDVNFKEGGGAVNFDITVGQSVNNYAAIYNSGMTSVDASDYEDNGTVFVWVYIPDATYVTSCTLRWGSSDSNYWEKTVTAQFNGRALDTGWNRLGFAWSTATETGTGDSSAIDYLYFRVTYSASQTSDTDFILDDIRVESPTIMEPHYYSKNFCQTSAGVKQANFSSGDDVSLLENEDDDTLMYLALQDAALIKENYNDIPIWEKRAATGIKNMRKRYMNEKKLPTRRYY